MLMLVSYDLTRPGQNYSGLYDAIQRCGECSHCLQSVWLVQTNLSATQIQIELRKYIDDNDSLFVVDITGQSRNGWMLKSTWDWVRAHDI